MKKHAIRILLGLAVVLLFVGHAAGPLRLAPIDALEAVTYDARLLLTMPGGRDPRVVIVDIDEKSLAIEGRWPWRRDKVAALVDRLFDQYGVAVAGFDVVFAEREDDPGLAVLRSLAQGELAGNAQFRSAVEAASARLDTDTVLADRLRNRPVILGYYFSSQQVDGRSLALGAIPRPVLAAGTFTGRNIAFASFQGYGGNLDVLQSAAAGAGHFTPWTDRDGMHRSVPMLAEYRGAYYEPLALAVVRLLAGSPEVKPGFPPDTLFNRNYPGLEWLEAGQLRIPVDERANALVPYRGREGSFPYVSATDVLNGSAPVETLRNRIVLVGTTAPGLQDLRSTPVAPLYPGVEIHANLIAGILDGDIKQKPPYVLGAEVLLLAAAGLTMALALPFLTPLRATIASAVLLGAVAGTNLLFWSEANLVLPLASGLLLVTALWALNTVYGYFVETRAKRQIAGRFGQYVPPEIVEEMSRNPGASSMESAERELTILFSDVRGFTSLSEGLDAPTLSALMNEYLTPMTRAIHARRGTIDKYMGDAIMAFWGAPLEDASHASHGVQASLDMLQRLETLNGEFAARGWPRLAVGIGLNSGRVRVGNMGSEIRMAYTVMGDAVNLASRLESLTKRYGVQLLVGEATRAAAPEFVYREIDRVRVKGKDEPVSIHEPIGLHAEVPQERLDRLKLFHQALRFYRAQDWDKAELQLLNLLKGEPGCALYQAFLERIAHFRANPPGPGWDGVFDFDTK